MVLPGIKHFDIADAADLLRQNPVAARSSRRKELCRY